MHSVLLIDPKDNVVTCLRPLGRGQKVKVAGRNITLREDIPLYHKMAIGPLSPGDFCFKYGQVIGRALTPIQPGDHVHVHNLESTRGRGDQVGGAEK